MPSTRRTSSLPTRAQRGSRSSRAGSRASASSNTQKLGQLAVAAPQVIAHRLTRMALAGPFPNARDRKEFMGMVVEKQIAFSQAWINMATEMVRAQQNLFWSAFTGQAGKAASPHATFQTILGKGLEPVHRKAVANSKRLARTKLR